MTAKTYSNPRMEVEIPNWPVGHTRTTALFRVECAAHKQRGTRMTRNPKTGQWNATKKLTYALQVRIVTGSDGRTYFLEKTMYGHLSVMKSDMHYQEEAIFPSDPRYADLVKLFDTPVDI